MTIITNMTDRQDASHLLRAIRAQLSITQEQLAERLGVSFATVNRWEGGANAPQKAARDAILALAQEAGGDLETSATETILPPPGPRPRDAEAAPPTHR